jgi:DedD protein
VNSLYDRDNDEHDNPGEREISLGTSTVLGIFFALALLCAVFFGFGYSMGRRSAQPLASTLTLTEPVATAGIGAAKPTPASALPTPTQQPADTDTTGTTTAVIPDTQPDTQPEAATPQPTARPVSLSRTTPPPAVAAPGAGPTIVQVAAVSHKEDADLLTAALKKRGYTVAVHQEPDKLLHVQLGPFASKKDADAMRQRLLTDGYNAIVK